MFNKIFKRKLRLPDRIVIKMIRGRIADVELTYIEKDGTREMRFMRPADVVIE